jgi:hypothetical protein
MFGYMDIQWGWREVNGKILGNKKIEGLYIIPNLEKKYEAKKTGASLTLKKKQDEYVL